MSRSLLCETVTGRSMAELLAARDAATDGDMIELRLDGVADVDVAAALSGRRRPVVVTCRPQWEGGRFDGSEESRRDMLARALELGAEFVDVEWKTLRDGHQPGFADVVQRDPQRIVVSSHDFEGVPSDLGERAREMRASGARTIKLAVTTRRLADMLPLREIACDGDAVVIGMGDTGVPSRLLATRFGSRWTYAGRAVAPGQIPAARMVGEFRFPVVGAATRLFGVVSSNAMHSLSPVMHNAAFAAAGLDAAYVPLQPADFGDFLEFAAAMGLEGASVTIPFKRDALNAAVRADASTRHVGAANTLRRIGPPAGGRHMEAAGGSHLNDAERSHLNGAESSHPSDVGGSRLTDGGAGFSRPEWEATNTDVDGFLEPLASALGPVSGLRVAVLGAGGSARAVIVALRSRGAAVAVHARRPEQAEELTASLGASIGAWPVPSGSWDVLVNCTPLGGATLRNESPLPGGPFTGRLVYDLTYGPGESALIREAREAGCATLDGLPMLVAQAERQFEWWTGQKPAPGVMERAVRSRIGPTLETPRTTETPRHGGVL